MTMLPERGMDQSRRCSGPPPRCLKVQFSEICKIPRTSGVENIEFQARDPNPKNLLQKLHYDPAR